MLGVDVDLVMKGVLTNPDLTRSCSTPWSDLVSAVSCWQLAMLVNRGRLALSLDMERLLALLAGLPSGCAVAGPGSCRGRGSHPPAGVIPRALTCANCYPLS